MLMIIPEIKLIASFCLTHCYSFRKFRFVQSLSNPVKDSLEQEEIPIKASEARKRLGVGVSRFSAIKCAMGIPNRRFVVFSQMALWLREHPGFQEKQIYHRPDCGCAVCVEKRSVRSRQSVGAVGQVVGA